MNLLRPLRTLLFLSLGAAVLNGVAGGATPVPTRPNILLLLSDDHSYPYLGCYGNKDVKTPNLDRFAAQGMRFDRMFVGCPQCVPSRATLMTGRSAVAVRMVRFTSPLPAVLRSLPRGPYSGARGWVPGDAHPGGTDGAGNSMPSLGLGPTGRFRLDGASPRLIKPTILATDSLVSAEGTPSIRNARGIQFWTENRRANWTVASHFANMARLLLLGAYPSGVEMRSTDFNTAPDLAMAEQQLAELRVWTESLGLDFGAFWTTQENWKTGILNGFGG